jgi:hypothetical protein
MTMLTCETVRDRMPELAAGLLVDEEADPVERHLDACAACSDERELVLLLRGTAPAPPPGLDARIGRAVRTGATVAARRRTVPSFAIAAGAAFALLTGSLIVRGGIGAGGEGTGAAVREVTLGWPTVADPILRAAPVLSDLTVEELESLLAELES